MWVQIVIEVAKVVWVWAVLESMYGDTPYSGDSWACDSSKECMYE